MHITAALTELFCRLSDAAVHEHFAEALLFPGQCGKYAFNVEAMFAIPELVVLAGIDNRFLKFRINILICHGIIEAPFLVKRDPVDEFHVPPVECTGDQWTGLPFIRIVGLGGLDEGQFKFLSQVLAVLFFKIELFTQSPDSVSDPPLNAVGQKDVHNQGIGVQGGCTAFLFIRLHRAYPFEKSFFRGKSHRPAHPPADLHETKLQLFLQARKYL
jgi:hypothetical protein